MARIASGNAVGRIGTGQADFSRRPAKQLAIGLLGWLLCGAAVDAAELSVADLKIRPDGNGLVVVSGAIDNESTYGVTVMGTNCQPSGRRVMSSHTARSSSKPTLI